MTSFADAYNFSDLSTLLAGHVGELCGSELQAVAAAAPAFSWPVYASMPLLHAVCREAVHRWVAGQGSEAVARWRLLWELQQRLLPACRCVICAHRTTTTLRLPRRSMAGALPLPQAQWVLAASVKGAMVSKCTLCLHGSAYTCFELVQPMTVHRVVHACGPCPRSLPNHCTL